MGLFNYTFKSIPKSKGSNSFGKAFENFSQAIRGRTGKTKTITKTKERFGTTGEIKSRVTTETTKYGKSKASKLEKPLTIGQPKEFRRGTTNPFEREVKQNPFEPNPSREYWIMKPEEEKIPEPIRENVVAKFGENQSPFVNNKQEKKKNIW